MQSSKSKLAVLDRARHDIKDALKTALFIAVAIEIELLFSSSFYTHWKPWERVTSSE